MAINAQGYWEDDELYNDTTDYGSGGDPYNTDPTYDPDAYTPVPDSNGSEPVTPGTQTFDDGSTLTTNPDGTVSSTDAPPGATKVDANGNWYDAAGNILKQIAPLSPIFRQLTAPYLNNLQSGGLLNKATDAVSGAIDAVNNVAVPDLTKMIPTLQLQVQQGQMTPAQYQAVLAQIQGKMEAATANAASMDDSQMRNVQTDQGTLLGAKKALGQLGDIAENRGMTEADRAAFASFMNQSNANAAQQRAAQLQQLQMQGNAGTGAELAARLSGVQGTSNANAAAGANMAQAAQARALQAMQAGLSGNTALNQQLFGQDTAKATAQDAVNQFNAAAKNAINQTNAQMAQQANLANFNTANQIALANQTATNQAGQSNSVNQQQANLTNFNRANDIAGKNTEITNENLKMPYTATQANYTNSMDKAKNQSTAGIYGGKILGDMATAQIGRSTAAGSTPTATATGGSTTPPANTTTSGGSSSDTLNDVGKVIDIGSKLWTIFSDEDLKTDKEALSDAEVDDMMAGLTGYKYRYKGKGNPQQAGVMAQDAERGMPDSVVDTPAGKMIQKPEMMSNVLAVLANQHNRIKRMEGQ